MDPVQTAPEGLFTVTLYARQTDRHNFILMTYKDFHSASTKRWLAEVILIVAFPNFRYNCLYVIVFQLNKLRTVLMEKSFL